jgi:hypothetical protein
MPELLTEKIKLRLIKTRGRMIGEENCFNC